MTTEWQQPRAYTVRFDPVDVHAVSEADALDAAATLIRSDPDFYVRQVLLWEGDENGRIAGVVHHKDGNPLNNNLDNLAVGDAPPDQRTP